MSACADFDHSARAFSNSASVATRPARIGVGVGAKKSGAEAETFPAIDNKLMAKIIMEMSAIEFFKLIGYSHSIGEEPGWIPPRCFDLTRWDPVYCKPKCPAVE